MTDKKPTPEDQARANIHPSTLNEMTRVGYDARGDLRAYSFAHSPCSPLPQADQPKRPARVDVIGGTGWQNQREFGADGQHPTPGVAACDRLMDEQDRKDKVELAERMAKEDEWRKNQLKR
jgi:hypothetical protein